MSWYSGFGFYCCSGFDLGLYYHWILKTELEHRIRKYLLKFSSQIVFIQN